MSATAPLTTSDGSAWYSACARSGGLPALSAAMSFVTSASPWAGRLTFTRISGCWAFQVFTTRLMFGAHDQNVSVTGVFGRAGAEVAAVDDVAPPELLPPQAASSTIASATSGSAAPRRAV